MPDIRIVEKGQMLIWGRQGENNARTFLFPVEEWIRDYGDGGVFTILNQRSADDAPYPCVTVYDAEHKRVSWTPTETDLAFKGSGECQLIYVVNGVRVKEAIHPTYNEISLGQTLDPPSPWQAWVDSVIEAGSKAEAAVAHYPKIGENGNWYVWNVAQSKWEDTTIHAQGEKGDTGNGIASTTLNADYTLTITFTDGTSYTTPPIRGAQGEKGDKGDKGDRGERGSKGDKGDIGVGISSVVSNPDYTLTIFLSDGTSYTTIPVRGEKGDRGQKGNKGDKGDEGVGILQVLYSEEDYTLTIYLTNGNWYKTGSLRGGKGAKGDTGVGIADIRMNADYSLTIIMTDGTEYTTKSIRGEKGFSPRIHITQIVGGHRVTIQDEFHIDYFDVMDGGTGIPEGGTMGQVLTKKSDTDFDVEWKNGGVDCLKIVDGKLCIKWRAQT